MSNRPTYGILYPNPAEIKELSVSFINWMLLLPLGAYFEGAFWQKYQHVATQCITNTQTIQVSCSGASFIHVDSVELMKAQRENISRCANPGVSSSTRTCRFDPGSSVITTQCTASSMCVLTVDSRIETAVNKTCYDYHGETTINVTYMCLPSK